MMTELVKITGIHGGYLIARGRTQAENNRPVLVLPLVLAYI